MRLDEFRDVLDEALGSPPSASAARQAVLERVGRRRAVRRMGIGAVAIVLVLGVTVSVVAWSKRAGHSVVSVNQQSRTTTTTTPVTDDRAGWQPVARPPYAGAVAAVRIDREVVVAFNGRSSLRFASFDPATQRWTKLPKPPLDLQAPYTESPTFANIGSSIIVWGHEQTQPPVTSTGPMRIMAYSPATNSWQVLPESPIHTLIQATPIWTGKELIVWGGNGADNSTPNVGAAFDPALRRWHLLPAGPMRAHEDPVTVWTGHEMIVWGGFRLENPPDPVEGAAFNPRTNSWRVLPDSGLSLREVAATAWTGHLFLVWSGSGAGNGPADPADGAGYDPATNRWDPIAVAPIRGRELASFAWTGRSLFVWGGMNFDNSRQTLQDGAMYNPATGTWSVLPASPLVGRWGAVTIWTGSDVLVVDGYGPSKPGVPSEPARTDAAVYRPPAPAS